MSQSQHLEMCRICLVEPEDNKYVPFVNIMTPIDGELKSKKQMLDLLGINVESDDVKPKMICNYCAISLDSWETMKKKANESEIVINYIASKKFGVNMPETSIASTSSQMLRNNEEPSQETPFKHSRLPSKRSNKFDDSMPGTSIASTSSQEPRFNDSRLPSKQSNKFGDSMPGTSIASTSSQEPRFKDSRLPSKPSNKFGDSMPGTSIASTSSQEPPFKHSQLPSKRSNKFGDSMPGTSIASTSSQETPFKDSRLPSKRSNKFGDSMPGTSIASTSSQETPFKDSRLPSKRSNKVGDSKPGTSIASTSSQEPRFRDSRLPSKRSNKFDASTPGTSIASTSSQEPRFKDSRLPSKQSNKNVKIINSFSSSNNKQRNSSRSLTANHSNSAVDDESDDSCILVTTPIETIVLLTDDEVTEYNNDDDDDDEDESIDFDVYYNEKKVDLSQNEVTIEVSSDSDNENNLRNEYFKNTAKKLYYCSICQKKNILNHDCSQHTKSFFTCLVPCCNILSRSKKDFIFHYQPHIGMSASEVMCRHCFRGIDQSNIDGNGRHIRCDTANAFKCYSCNEYFNGMQEFAFHKLKVHNGILMDANCNYLCLYCEESFPDVLETTDHIKHCLENQAKNVTAASTKLKKPTKNETELLPVKPKNTKNVMAHSNGNKKKVQRTSLHVLFTCLKPSCDKIFQSFSNFKHHYRRHFGLGNALVCWQCCTPLSDTPDLRAHQVRNNCRIPGMYKCFKCTATFDDLENLSIHKLTFHEGKLIANKKNRKTIKCAFCQMDITIFNFKSHLDICTKKDVRKNTFTTKYQGTYTCLICKKEFGSSISLSNHSRIHKSSNINSNLKKE